MADPNAIRAYLARMGVPQATQTTRRFRVPSAAPRVEGLDPAAEHLGRALARTAEDPGFDVEIGEAQIEAPTLSESLGDATAERARNDVARQAGYGSGEEQRRATEDREYRARMAQEDADERERTYDRIQQERGLLARMDAEGTFDAMQQGVTQGMTLGFADELAGAGRALAGTGDYETERNRVRSDVRRAQEENPTAFGVAQVTGGMLPALAIPGSTARTLGGRVLQSAGAGAGMGTVTGLGMSEAEDAWSAA
jgi:hypothetical protein